MVLDVVTLALGIATGQLLYDLVANWLEMRFSSDNDDDKGAFGW